jgi:hypothetical protein
MKYPHSREPGTRPTVADFQAFECEGNLVEWRIIENHYSKMNGEPPYFVYRVVECHSGRAMSEYLLKNGKVSNCGGDGHFANYQEIGIALILNHANEQAGGARNFYENDYWNWLSSQYDTEKEKELAASK